MSHGYYVHLASRSRYHYGTLYAESRLGSLIAIGKGDVPEEHWFAMARTFASSCRWQTQTPHGRIHKEVRGHAFSGGYYEWKGTKYVPSWGGSMFEALMPALGGGGARLSRPRPDDDLHRGGELPEGPLHPAPLRGRPDRGEGTAPAERRALLRLNGDGPRRARACRQGVSRGDPCPVRFHA